MRHPAATPVTLFGPSSHPLHTPCMRTHRKLTQKRKNPTVNHPSTPICTPYRHRTSLTRPRRRAGLPRGRFSAAGAPFRRFFPGLGSVDTDFRRLTTKEAPLAHRNPCHEHLPGPDCRRCAVAPRTPYFIPFPGVFCAWRGMCGSFAHICTRCTRLWMCIGCAGGTMASLSPGPLSPPDVVSCVCCVCVCV